jgi:hypothetical protein
MRGEVPFSARWHPREVSYDLVFWKSQGRGATDPAVIYDRLANREPVAGVDELPIDRFLLALAEAFPGGVSDSSGRSRRRGRGGVVGRR